MKSVVGFVIFVLAVVGILFLTSRKEFPFIPDDSLHAGINNIGDCMNCHGPGRKYEMKKSHPPKFECFKCHTRQKPRQVLGSNG